MADLNTTYKDNSRRKFFLNLGLLGHWCHCRCDIDINDYLAPDMIKMVERLS